MSRHGRSGEVKTGEILSGESQVRSVRSCEVR